MHPIDEFFNKLHYDPVKQIFFIHWFDAAQIPRMQDFLNGIRSRGTEEFNKAFNSYINDKKHLVAGESGPIEISEFQMQMFEVYGVVPK